MLLHHNSFIAQRTRTRTLLMKKKKETKRNNGRATEFILEGCGVNFKKFSGERLIESLQSSPSLGLAPAPVICSVALKMFMKVKKMLLLSMCSV